MLVAASWLLAGQGVRAIDYEPFGLECLLMASDGVIVAQLPERAEGSIYRVEVVNPIRGRFPDDVIEISEPAEFRGTPPEFSTGEALLFLKKLSDTRWEVLGPSGDGRVQLSKTEADVRGVRLPLAGAEGLASYDRAKLLEALDKASCCFSFERTPDGVNPVRRCEPSRFERAMQQSDLTAGLLQILEDPNRKPCSL